MKTKKLALGVTYILLIILLLKTENLFGQNFPTAIGKHALLKLDKKYLPIIDPIQHAQKSPTDLSQFLTPHTPASQSRHFFDLKLDSIVDYHLSLQGAGYQRSIKNSFQYHQQNQNLTVNEMLYVDPIDGHIVYGGKEEYSYDGKDRLAVYKTYISPLSWKEYSRFTITYNDDSLEAESLVELWENDTLIPFEKTVYTYNVNHLLSSDTEYNWNQDSNAWIALSRFDYTYTPSQQLQSATNSQYEIGVWIPSYKNEYSYAQGLIKVITESYWSGNSWKPEYKADFTYNVNHNLVQQLKSVRDAANQVWIPDQRYFYEYDLSYHKISENYDAYLLGNIPPWEPRDSTRWTYDVFDNNLSQTKYDWVYTNGGEWEISDIQNHSYNTTIQLNSIVWPYSPFEQEQDTLLFTTQKTSTTMWKSGVGVDSIQYYYSEWISGTLPITTSVDLLYPNPANDQIYLCQKDLPVDAEFYLFNTERNRVMQTPYKIGESISVHSLEPGIYFFLIGGPGKYYSGKLVIQR